MTELMLVLFIVLQGADIYTTITALKQGAIERNPFLGVLFNWFPPLPTLIVIKAAIVTVVTWADSFYANVILCALYAWVVINNWKVIRD